jgi:glycosyltransferase involved in cell wall biosynthesis
MKTSKEEPLVSVIVTTYNRKELLKETINAILNQTFRKFELIVVDNFSDYNFFAHIEYFNDKRIIPFQNQNNGIIAVNRNFGIKKARGGYIAFCDDDDYWKENKLEIQLKHFNNSDIVGVGAQAIKIGDLTFHRQKRVTGDLSLDFNDLLQCETAALSSLVVRNLGFLFDEDEGFKFVEDFDFQLGMALKTGKQIKILAEPLIYYRIHQLNNAKVVRNAEHIFNVLEKYRHEISEEVFRQLYSRAYFGLGIKALRVGDPNVVQYFKKAGHYGAGKMSFLSFMVAIYAALPINLRNNMLFWYYKVRRYLKNVGV